MFAKTLIIVLIFYYFLNEIFKDKINNAVTALEVIYPVVGSYIILNRQIFFVDFISPLFIFPAFLTMPRNNNKLLSVTAEKLIKRLPLEAQ